MKLHPHIQIHSTLINSVAQKTKAFIQQEESCQSNKGHKINKQVTKKQKKAIRVNQEQKGLTTNQISYK